MATISRTGISNGGTIDADHITRIIDALDGTGTATIVATGSFTGSLTGTATSASYATTAATATTATTATSATTATTATTAQGVDLTNTTTGTGPYYPVFSSTTSTGAILRTDNSTFTYNATTNTLNVTASYASYAASTPSAFPHTGEAKIVGNLTVTGSLLVTGSMNGKIEADPNLKLDLNALGKSATAGMLVIPCQQPTNAVAGAIYFDAADPASIKLFDGSNWITFTAG